jgi:hypothetical protein
VTLTGLGRVFKNSKNLNSTQIVSAIQEALTNRSWSREIWIVAARRETKRIGGRVHVFMAAPGGFSFALGQRQVGFGRGYPVRVRFRRLERRILRACAVLARLVGWPGPSIRFKIRVQLLPPGACEALPVQIFCASLALTPLAGPWHDKRCIAVYCRGRMRL